MDFNVRLEFVHTNAHDVQLYKEPMNRWVVKIEEYPTDFDPSPWVNYQGEMYVGQEGACYQVARQSQTMWTNLANWLLSKRMKSRLMRRVMS